MTVKSHVSTSLSNEKEDISLTVCMHLILFVGTSQHLIEGLLLIKLHKVFPGESWWHQDPANTQIGIPNATAQYEARFFNEK